MRPLSIRSRLTFWYSAVLAAALLLFAGGVWLSLRQALRASVQRNLEQHMAGLGGVVKAEIEEGMLPPQLREEVAEYAKALPEGYRIQVRNGRGETLIPDSGPVAGPSTTASKSVSINGQIYNIEGSASLSESDEMLEHLAFIMLMAIPAVLAGAGLGGYWLSRRALTPVDAVTASARSITIQNLSERLPVPNTGDEIQRLSEAWNETLGRLDAAVKRLTRFTADASHELRSPIALMRTAAEVALRRDRSQDQYRDALREILREAESTSRLIEDLLMLARADGGVNEFAIAPVDLSALVLEAKEQARLLAQGRGVEIEADIPDGGIQVAANEAGLRRLVSVLLDNAVKFTPAGGEVRIRVEQRDTWAVMEVRDTGIGMDVDVVPHIFERFYRADTSRNREAGGSGLGLSIAKWIADRHGADISVESAPGRGSAFRVKLRMAFDSANQPGSW